MRFWIDFVIAVRSLIQHTRRTIALGAAIGGVTALLVLLVALSAGVRETMLRSATTLMTGHVNIGGFYKVTSGQGAPVVTEYKKALETARAAAPEIVSAVHRGRGWAKIISDTSSTQVGVNGLDIADEPQFREVVQLVKGSWDDFAKPGTMLMFEEMAKKLEVGIGDSVTISAPTTRGQNNTIDVRVVAIAREMGLLSKWSSFVSVQTLRDLYQLNANSTGAVHLFVKDMKTIPAVREKLVSALSAAGWRIMDQDPQPFWAKFEKVSREDWTGQKLDITTWEDEVSFTKWVLSVLDALVFIVIFILMVIVIVGIMNTMWIAIRERTREIGTLRAIGMQRLRVLWMFVLEAGLLGIVGTISGALFGAGVAALLNFAEISMPLAMQLFLMSDKLWLVVQPDSVLRGVATIAFFTTLAAIYPALQAARLKPVTAMHHIG